MPKGFWLANDGHFVQAVAPIDINGAATNSDVWSMGKYAHASIVIMLGVTGGATTVTLEECDNFTPSNTTAIAFSYYIEATAGGDTLGVKTAATATGFAASTNDGVFYVIEIDAAALTDGRPNLRVVLSDPSSATLAAVAVFLSGSRYGQEQSPTAIA